MWRSRYNYGAVHRLNKTFQSAHILFTCHPPTNKRAQNLVCRNWNLLPQVCFMDLM